MKKILPFLTGILIFCAFDIIAQATNIDFESTPGGAYTASNAVSGWTVESINSSGKQLACGIPAPNFLYWLPGSPEFSIITTPILNVPTIGTIPNSPLGGSRIARLNSDIVNSTSSYITKLSQTFPVTSSNTVLDVAFAGVWDSQGHACCDQPFFSIIIKSGTNVISCLSYTMIPQGGSCSNGVTGYSTTVGGLTWTNWQVMSRDLSPYIGTALTLEILSADCNGGSHYGTLFFDARMGNQFAPYSYSTTTTPLSYNFCPGSNLASIQAPLGYASYQWYGPGNIAIPTGTLSLLSINNPVAGSVYSVALTYSGMNNSSCQNMLTYSLTTTQVVIAGLAAHPACFQGFTGSATVAAVGSATGYLYTWTNSNNQTVGTGSVATNLSAGIYSIHVSAPGLPACGSSDATVHVMQSQQNLSFVNKYYCGNTAYLNLNSGTNFQWYTGTTAVPAIQGGNASSYTVTSPAGTSTYYVSYTNTGGCKDSLQFVLTPTTTGSPTISVISTCEGATTGEARIILPYVADHLQNNLSYSITSTGSTPSYSNVLNATSLYTLTASSLAGGTFSISAFNGSCKYTPGFTVPVFNYTLMPAGSVTICPGQSIGANISFATPAALGQYSFSWLPTTSLLGSNSQNVIISPATTSPGSVSTTVYSVSVTSPTLTCILTKTLGITAVNPLPPTVATIPTLCANGTAYTVISNPSGGTFTGANNAISAGILTPSLALSGTNTFTYTYLTGPCAASVTSSFFISNPSVTVNSSSISCGQSTTLNASGADSYLWSTSATGSSVSVAPLVTSNYSVTGTNTTTGCSKQSVTQVVVIQTLAISATGNFSVCAGQQVILSASGANSYTWSNSTSNASISVPAIANTSYTVIGSDIHGCKDTVAIIIPPVFPVPTLSITGSFSVCSGDSTILNVSGAHTYSLDTIPIYPAFPAGEGSYTLTGVSSDGCVAKETITVTALECVGIAERSEDIKEIKIYPNPTHARIVVDAPEATHISLMDCMGKILIADQIIHSSDNTIDLSAYANGVYFLKMTHDKDIRFIKLIKKD